MLPRWSFDGKQLEGSQSYKSRTHSLTQLVCTDSSKSTSYHTHALTHTLTHSAGGLSGLKAKETKPSVMRGRHFWKTTGKMQLGGHSGWYHRVTTIFSAIMTPGGKQIPYLCVKPHTLHFPVTQNHMTGSKGRKCAGSMRVPHSSVKFGNFRIKP